MKKLLLFSLVLLFCVNGKAQTEKRNSILSVFFEDLEFAREDKAQIDQMAAGQSFLAGKMHMGNPSHLSKDVNFAVSAAIGESNRLRLTNFDEKYKLSGTISDISFDKRERVEEYKDKQGNVKQEKKIDHFANVSVTLNISCSATGQEWKSPFSARTAWGAHIPNEREALELVLGDLRRQIVRYLNTTFDRRSGWQTNSSENRRSDN